MTPPLPTTSKPTWKPSPSEGEVPPTNTLWIGNLGPDVSDADLIELFGKYGHIDSITNYSNRSYAFVQFKKVEDAKAARDKIQGTLIRRNPLKIEFAKPAKPCKSLWVSGISQSVSREELEGEFNKFGNIQEFKLLRDRSTACVDYFRIEDASQALKNMNGKRIGGDVLRVDFLRSQPSKREQGPDYRDNIINREGQFPNRNILQPGARWMPEDSFIPHPEPVFDGYNRHQFFSPAGRNGEGQPSKVLLIRYPPSAQVDEYLLHNAMILFGEIESIKTYDDRNCAFVQFRSVDEARLAKQGLQGKLFGNPRILIEYSNNEFATPNEAFGSYNDPKGPIPDMLKSEFPLGQGQGQKEYFTHGHHILGPRGVMRHDANLRPLVPPQGGFEPGYTNTEFDDSALVNKLHEGDHHTPLGGLNWRRPSSLPGILSSPSSGLRPQNISSSGPGDAAYATNLQRESKRLRVDGTLPHKWVDERIGFDDPLANFEGRKHHSPLNNTSFATGHGKRRPDNNDYVWRGVVAKGGTPICRARCVPIGEGIGSEIPDVVNCTARTGLDMLTKHYADAVGFRIVFFLPDSESDFAPYTEFLTYLKSKSRAGVAKFEDGTTLFLVPPSDFLTSILKVAGPERLYGVILEFPQAAPSVVYSNQPQKTSQSEYNEMPRDESSALQMNYDPIRYDGGVKAAALKTPGRGDPPNPVPSVTPQSSVPLTPELIATLASLLPASNKLSGAENSLTEVGRPTMNVKPNQDDQVIARTWIDKHQVPDQLNKFPSQSQSAPYDHLGYQSISSSISSLSSQTPVGYYQRNDHVFNSQSKAATSAIPLHHEQPMVSPYLDQQSDGMTQGTDPVRFFGSSSISQLPSNGITNVQPHLHGGHNAALASESDMKIQMQQHHLINSAMHGVGPEVGETEDEKNRRYQSTLLFAANLLSKIQQPPQ